MKTPALFLLGAMLALTFAADVRSQVPQAARTPLQQLQALKAQNEKLIERQTSTLLKLGEMEEQAKQIRFFSKRS